MIKVIKNKQDLKEYLKSLEIEENTVKIEALGLPLWLQKEPVLEVIPEFKPVPKYSNEEVETRALNLDLSLRRSA